MEARKEPPNIPKNVGNVYKAVNLVISYINRRIFSIYIIKKKKQYSGDATIDCNDWQGFYSVAAITSRTSQSKLEQTLRLFLRIEVGQFYSSPTN